MIENFYFIFFKGREFYCCGKPKEEQCGYFEWKDEQGGGRGGGWSGGGGWGGGGGRGQGAARGRGRGLENL